MKKIIILILNLLPFNFTFLLIRALLAGQGFGIGSNISISGETKALKNILNSNKQPPIVFDVGANIGLYTNCIKSIRNDATIFAFEPSKTTFQTLQENTKSIESGLKLFNCALSDKEGKLTLYSDGDNSGLASLTKRNLDFLNVDLSKEEQVDVLTLDKVISDNNIKQIDLLKIDVEGHELDVLSGATASLESGIIKKIQFEFGGCNIDTKTFLKDFFYFLERYGFIINVIKNGKLVPLSTYKEIYEQFLTTNFIAVKK